MIFATVLPWRTTRIVSPFSTRVKISDALLRNSVNDRLIINVRPPSAGLYITAHWCAIAGRTAQEYNERKERHGPFWEDRYHASAVEADQHLNRCLVYIDLNMVRAGLVSHPEKWKESGFAEIQKPPKRYAIIDLRSLSELSGFTDLQDFQRAHREWVERGIENGLAARQRQWSESIAVGSRSFVEKVRNQLGFKTAHRDVTQVQGSYVLCEPAAAYAGKFVGEKAALSSENTLVWDKTVEDAAT